MTVNASEIDFNEYQIYRKKITTFSFNLSKIPKTTILVGSTIINLIEIRLLKELSAPILGWSNLVEFRIPKKFLLSFYILETYRKFLRNPNLNTFYGWRYSLIIITEHTISGWSYKAENAYIPRVCNSFHSLQEPSLYEIMQ